MSHMVKGTTNFVEENKDILVEALKEAYTGAEILFDAKSNIYGAGKCDIVVKRKNGRDIAFRKAGDGTYECLAYEPGYRNDQEAVKEALKSVYSPYAKGVLRQMMKKNAALRNYQMGKEERVERNGQKVKRIQLRSGGSAYGGGY